MAPLGTWGGIAEGINSGIRNAATIRGIQHQQEQEDRALRQDERQRVADERAKVVQGQQDTTFSQGQAKNAREVAEYNRLHDRNIDPGSVIDSLGLDDEGKQYISKAVKPFLPEGGKISLTDIQTIKENVLKDPAVASEINNHRRRSLGNQITAMKDELSTLGSESGGLAQVATYNQKKAVLDQAEARMQELDPNYFKKKELGLHERTATAAEKTADKAPTTEAMRDKYSRMPEGLAKAALGQQIKEAEAHKIALAKAGHENELEKARILAGGKTAAQEAKAKKDAVTQTTATVNKYYADLSATVKEKLKDPELDEVSKKEWQKIGQNISVYRNNDLKAVQNGADPPNIKNLTEGAGPTYPAAPAKPVEQKVKQPPPKEGDTFRGGKGSYIYKNGKWNLQTGAAVPERSMVPEANAATAPAAQGGTIIQDDRPAGISPSDWKYLQTLTPLARQAALDQRKALKKSAYMAQMQN